MRLDVDFSGQESCYADRRCRLAGELCAPVEEAHARSDLVLRDEHGLDVAVAADLDRELAGEGCAEAVGHRFRLDPHGLACLEALVEGIRELGLDRDDASALCAERDAPDEAASADGNEDNGCFRSLLDDLEPDRALAGDRPRVVEGM